MEHIGGDWAERDDTKYISEQRPDCLTLPVSCRYRSFSSHLEASQVRYYGSEHDFFVCKRKRFEEATQDVEVPVSPVYTDAFKIAQHQYETFRWMNANRTAEEILVRFSTDKKQGARPTIAALNCAIRLFRQQKRVDAMLELAEGLLMDERTISVSTVQEMMTTLADDPLRAAQLLFLFQGRMGYFTIPTHLWSTIASLLAKKSYDLSLITDEFLWIFENVLEIVRSYGDSLDETALIAFGRCLLASGQPLTSAIRLVQDELLSGRNMVSRDGPSNYLLSAFLSDLLIVLCGCEDGDTSKAAMSATDLLNFTSDVIKFSYARKVAITSRGFDTVIRLLDSRTCYHKMCVAFGAMSVLTTPTTVSLLRVLEVVRRFPTVTDAWQSIYGTVDVCCFVIWCLSKHKTLLSVSSQMEEEELASMEVGACLGQLIASRLDTEQRYLYELFMLLLARTSACAAHCFPTSLLI
ncbi:hypothetical protein STCU_05923 [Strigomonas culicis]|uniref:Uncharacterized protein n=1 Tax=Strigomonas culicis TaxID=28005 RepID=S9VJ81_9TRYP|nr:hypothetical protein STCU_05923 [Strigomonas culicis]|eukprot:EPY27096.1 hypothetical protein STCU_05923 [Strigomonas culicis]